MLRRLQANVLRSIATSCQITAALLLPPSLLAYSRALCAFARLRRWPLSRSAHVRIVPRFPGTIRPRCDEPRNVG